MASRQKGKRAGKDKLSGGKSWGKAVESEGKLGKRQFPQRWTADVIAIIPCQTLEDVTLTTGLQY